MEGSNQESYWIVINTENSEGRFGPCIYIGTLYSCDSNKIQGLLSWQTKLFTECMTFGDKTVTKMRQFTLKSCPGSAKILRGPLERNDDKSMNKGNYSTSILQFENLQYIRILSCQLLTHASDLQWAQN
jgi:hypothetical protein